MDAGGAAVDIGPLLLDALALAALILSLGFSALRLRRRLLPAWVGAPALLAELVIGVALLIWLSQLLGLVGLLYAPLLIALSALLAGAIVLYLPAPSTPSATSPASAEPFARGVALAVAAVVFAQWALATEVPLNSGIVNWDSLSLHMPFATEIARGHSVTGLHYLQTVFANPQNSELFHAIGILLLDRDTLSLFINFGWLGLAFLAAWCIGRPYGFGHHSVAAAAVFLGCNTYLLREPGSGKSDIVSLALLLSAIAILVNAWAQERRQTLPLGWPLALAGLAAGLAVGTRVTEIAMVAALSVAVVALAPIGKRRLAAGQWFLPLLAGGGFWYLRNLVVAGNPIPEVARLGPISLPHPEKSLQGGPPNFNVAHYATDTRVWSDYFGPGLEYTFGVLWPLVVVAALTGAVLAVGWGQSRLLRWLGGVSLFGVLAYLLTPYGAGGPEGTPNVFAINTRFVIPSLLIGLVLLPLARGLEGEFRRRALLLALLAAMVVTNRSYEVLEDPASALALGVALLIVLVGGLREWRRGMSGRLSAAELAVVAVVAGALFLIGFSVQNSYLRDRYHAGIPWFQLDSSYRWARDVSGAHIGLVGTAAGTLKYGYYGTDLSNRVDYLGVERPRGGLAPIPDCHGFRVAVNDADLDYLVTSPFLDYIRSVGRFSPEAGWLRGESAVVPIDVNGPVTVWRVRSRLDPDACGLENVPLRHVPRPTGTLGFSR